MPLKLRRARRELRFFFGLLLTGTTTCLFGAPSQPPAAHWRGDQAMGALRRQGTYEGLRMAYDATLYTVEGSSRRARNQAQGLDVEFAPGEIKLEHARGAVRMRLAGYGYGKRLKKAPPGQVITESNRVEYRRGELTEWYVNEASGLEQGFTLAKRPGNRRSGESLILALQTSGGLVPELDAGGTSVLLREGRRVVLRYSGLKSWDARGREIESYMQVVGRQVRLIVDDLHAKYPITVDPVFTQQAKLTAADGAAQTYFGHSVALSGDTALVGAIRDSGRKGAVYVFVRKGTAWTQQMKLIASDGSADDFFGSSVELSGDTALVGAIGDDGNRGSIYVFVRNGTAWSQQAKLTASDGAGNDYFGQSLALSGDTAIIGTASNIGSNVKQGSAYVFVRTGTTWSQKAKLTASDGAEYDYFGVSVALNGDTALVGAFLDDTQRGSAYIFVRNGTTWTQQQKLLASDGVARDYFGGVVALSDGSALVGASSGGISRGSAYVFVRNGTTWTQQQKLTGSDDSTGENFGATVALSGDTALIGAYGKDNNKGAAYVFTRSGATWSQKGKLTASDGAQGDVFGTGVALSGSTALIGAEGDTIGTSAYQGSAYVFAGALNDEPADATVITTLPYRTTQDTRFATSNAGTDPPHSCTIIPGANTVWFRYVAEFTGKLLVSTIGSSYDTILTAYPGSSTAGSELACNDDYGQSAESRIQVNVVSGQSYLIQVSDWNQDGGTLVVNVDKVVARIGVVRSGAWYLDSNGSGAFESGTDQAFDWWAGPGTIFVSGDWNGDGRSKAGFFKNGLWYLDYNGNGVWEPGVDKLYGFGWNDPCVVPITGDWNGDGRTKVGVFCNGFWYLDSSGNGVWDGPATDKLYGWGWAGVTPLVGDWNGDTRSKIGFFVNGLFYLDYNGNGLWEPGTDKQYGWGWTGVVPLVGDWNADGRTKIGFWVNGLWYLDYNGNGVWEPETDKLYSLGWSGTTPITGDWNADGKTKIGVFTNGFWYLDFNGDGVWSGAPTDRVYGLGQAGDLPAVGRW